MIKFWKKDTGKPSSISLALSGGGARGAIQLGVLQALQEENIQIDAIAGTSIGSIVGAFFCAGVSPLEMKTLMKTQSFKKIFHFSWGKKGLLKMERLYELMQQYMPDNDFKKLKIPFYACVSNLDLGRHEVLDSGDLHKAVAASASIPVIFEPVEINGYHYVDGGLFCNMPASPLVQKDSFVVGVHVNNYKPAEELNIITVAERVFTLVILENAKKSFELCDYLINPFLDRDYGLLDFKNTDVLYDIGYESGKEFVHAFRQGKEN